MATLWTSATNTVYEYTPGTNTWASKAPAPTPSLRHGRRRAGCDLRHGELTASFDGKKVYRYDPVANTMVHHRQPPAPTVRA
ncbi:MAG: hypothetical protein U0163_13715 [Gemmatimonadaceae bacterium]